MSEASGFPTDATRKQCNAIETCHYIIYKTVIIVSTGTLSWFPSRSVSSFNLILYKDICQISKNNQETLQIAEILATRFQGTVPHHVTPRRKQISYGHEQDKFVDLGLVALNENV